VGSEIRVALIGLDTSHSIEFTRRLQDPECPAEQKVEGMRVVSCLRFSTPFQSEEGLDNRQKQLESWGVKVVTDFNEAVADCDAIMLEINDPAYHLEYFMKCADLGKPMFVDKPLADSIENGKLMCKVAKEKGIRMFSSSSLRFASEFMTALGSIPNAKFASIYGPLGAAPAGSAVIWYGVHAFEMLQRAMGRGATGVFARRDKAGVVAVVEYEDNRRGVVELTDEAYFYGGCLRDEENGISYSVDAGAIYSVELDMIVKFFQGAEAPVAIEDTLEVMALLDAADRSTSSGKIESL
jgi:predicted dehydrogenase